jgi:putative ubiquitin-RnfH superfamily antitoxin RatB of RatAB toxin-antitoxin module
MAARESIRVEVVFALPERQKLMPVEIAAGATCADVISQSGIADSFPGIDLATVPLAIWGSPVSHDREVRNGDRVELLRPLAIDPRDARRQRALAGQFMGHADNGQQEDS